MEDLGNELDFRCVHGVVVFEHHRQLVLILFPKCLSGTADLGDDRHVFLLFDAHVGRLLRLEPLDLLRQAFLCYHSYLINYKSEFSWL